MKTQRLMLILTCLNCILIIGCEKTPGQKLDSAIDSSQKTAKNAEEKYEEKKEAAKKKSDKAREDLAKKIKP